MPAHYSVAVIAGDGIGPEIVPRAIEVVDRVAGTHGFTVDWTPYPWGSDHYREHGSMMPPDALDQLRPYDALFFGAVGAPDVPDTVTLWGLLIPIRRAFDQYVNLRPVRHIEGVPSPLVRPDGIDLVVVRENSEGEYSDTGGRENRGAPDE